MILTNAAGGIRQSFRPGDLMLITDHLAMTELPGLTDNEAPECNRHAIWDSVLTKQAAGIPTSLTVHSGVYAMMPGPNYETPAEVRMLRKLGADAVGMSTVPEALLARTLGMRVLGVSCITNVAAGLSAGPLNHDEIGATAGAVESEITAWLHALLARITPNSSGPIDT